MSIDRSEEFRFGDSLAFIIGPFRGGTTLLRKIIDSHSRLFSPAETWFLLPLLRMWYGNRNDRHVKQTAVALQNYLNKEQFLDCCRGFAASYYAANMPDASAFFVDKTPLYLTIGHDIAEIFPNARFLFLTRDPRSTYWSRLTWKHMHNPDPKKILKETVADIHKQAELVNSVCSSRQLLISYERLCLDPQTECAKLCRFFDLPCENTMVDYGRFEHHEGWGDENARLFGQLHDESIARWYDSLSRNIQSYLLSQCGSEALTTLRLDHLVAGKPWEEPE